MGGAPMASPRAATRAAAASGGAPGGRAPMTFAQRVSAMLAHGSSGGAARSGSIGVGRAGDVRTPPPSDAAMHGRDPTRQGQDDVTTLQYRHQHGGPLLTPLLNTHHQQSQQQDLARELPSSSQQPLAYRHEVTARARAARRLRPASTCTSRVLATTSTQSSACDRTAHGVRRSSRRAFATARYLYIASAQPPQWYYRRRGHRQARGGSYQQHWRRCCGELRAWCLCAARRDCSRP